MKSIDSDDGLSIVIVMLAQAKPWYVKIIAKLNKNDSCNISYISNTLLRKGALIQSIYDGFETETHTKVSKIITASKALLYEKQKNKKLLILVDEAHLNAEQIELIRLLANIDLLDKK